MAERKFKIGDLVTRDYSSSADPVRLIKENLGIGGEFKGWFWREDGVAEPSWGDSWDKESSMTLFKREVKTVQREFEIDISDLRVGDVIVEANLNGSITKHRVRREVAAIPEPLRTRVVSVDTPSGNYLARTTVSGRWVLYKPERTTVQWEDFVEKYEITGVKEANAW